jgi:class 3 adenylate cyclase
LIEFCPACGAQFSEAAKFCGACGTKRAGRASTTDHLLRGERRTMTVLFADLVESTQLIDGRDPEELMEGYAAYRVAVRRTIERLGGFILHYLGDGIVVCFGYPIGNEDAAEQAVRAGLGIAEAVTKIKAAGKPLRARVGVATGLVVSEGNPGADRIEDNFTGAALNIAARLQTLAQPGEVVVAQSTARLVKGIFVTKALGPQILKGFAEPIEAFVVTGLREGRSRFERRLESTKAPLIDRNAERALLLRLFGEAGAGNGRAIYIVGEPGIGKSRLAHVLGEIVSNVEFRQFGLQCNAALANTALHPHIDLLQRQCGIGSDDDAATRLVKLRAFLASHPTADPEALALIANLLSIDAPDAPPVEMPPPEQRARTLATLRDLLLFEARNEPVVVVYEDLHWADPTSQDLVAQLVEQSREARLLLIATTRPGDRPGWADRENVVPVHLDRLSAGDSSDFAEAIGFGAGLSRIDIDRIVKRADGVPLFLEEMTRMMLDAPDRAKRAELPESLADLLTQRLDRLGPGRRLMQIGAVIGREFSAPLLAAVAESPEEELREPISAMLQSGLVEPTAREGVMMFKHALIQDAAYASLLARPRRELHARVAQCLMTAFSEIGEREPEMVARHLTAAAKPHEAASWWLRAGGAAIGRGSAQEAAALLQSGLDALSDQPNDEARLRAELGLLAVLGPAHMVMRGPGSPHFGAVQRRAYDTCRALPDTPSLFRITYGLALYHWGRAEFSTALPLAQSLDEIKEADPTTEHVLAAGNMNGMIRLHLGDAAEARRRFTETVSLYQPERDAQLYPHYLMDFGVFGRFYLAIACVMTGDGAIAAAHARDAAPLAERLAQPHSVGFSMLANFIVAMLRDDVPTAREWASKCAPYATHLGFPEFVAFADIALGWADVREGKVESGLRQLERGIAAWHATGFETWQTWFGALRMDALSRLGRCDEALEESARQTARAEQNGERLFMRRLAEAEARARSHV